MEDDPLRTAVCEYVSENKPDYMVPSFVIGLDEIPLTINRKVDKRALPEVNLDVLSAEYVTPSNDIERQIVTAFEKVLDRDKISVHDDFIRLGGDSLSSIRLVSNLENYNVGVADILSLRTPYAIARNINEAPRFDLDIYDLDSDCPLNEPQLNVYLDILANDKKDAYLIPLFMEISKEYSIDNINDALEEMLVAHPILGMCISDDFDVPYLVKGSKPSILVESEINENYITDFLTKPFDLHDNLSRFLITENDDNYSLFAVFHHLIFDALSSIVFKKRFNVHS